MEKLNRIYLKSNAKTVDGGLVPFMFYENKVYIVEKKHRTYVIRCKQWEVEVYPDAIKEIIE